MPHCPHPPPDNAHITTPRRAVYVLSAARLLWLVASLAADECERAPVLLLHAEHTTVYHGTSYSIAAHRLPLVYFMKEPRRDSVLVCFCGLFE